jgi:hypothetical protein
MSLRRKREAVNAAPRPRCAKARDKRASDLPSERKYSSPAGLRR